MNPSETINRIKFMELNLSNKDFFAKRPTEYTKALVSFSKDNVRVTKEEILRITALYRFILPKQYIRLAAGRNYLPDSGFSCFKSGANATITGNMLTVKGISMDEDIRTIKEMGYKVI